MNQIIVLLKNRQLAYLRTYFFCYTRQVIENVLYNCHGYERSV